ncbi:MAG: Carboxypeptidase regulatory-like domain [Solirubrobacteraceae bacterium]|jgi:hypothetical protein|nr:Carboxypeptidase regulatory-like domain [Solirubrobacteraceae bacterium]
MDITSCEYEAIVQFPDIRGALSYQVVVHDSHPAYNKDRPFTGPPFYDNQDGWHTPSGMHWFGLSGAAGPNCDGIGAEVARYQLRKVVAVFDSKPRIFGSVADADGKPVPGARISISGVSSHSAVTGPAGIYSVVVRKGRHQVRAPAGFCVVGVQPCTPVKSLNVSGAESVNFLRRSPPLIVRGTVRDEFRRGLGGIRMSLAGPESNTVFTDAGGRYELRVGKPGTYQLTGTAVGRGGGPYQRYYIVRNGAATEGTAADVTLNTGTSPVPVDWELDRRLQFSLTANDPARADGFSRTVATVRALTQRGDPAPGVELRIFPPADAVPRAVICTTGAGSHPLWPSLNSDGSVSPAGFPLGPDSTTDVRGEVSFRIFPGTDPRPFTINGSRRTNDSRALSTFSQSIPFVGTRSRGFNREQLARALFEGNVGASFFGDQSVVFETLAVRQRSDSDSLSGIDAVPVFTASSNRRGILFYTRGAVPPHSPGSPRVIGATDTGFVLENSLLQRISGTPTLPTLREWARGESVVVDGADGRTFLGWPLPTTAGGGLGTCIANGIRGERYVYGAHSPVRLLLRDRRGRTLGTDAKGKRHNTAPGNAFRIGTTSYVIAPAGAYNLTVTGTGSGPVTLEARRGGATSIARFTARKGASVALNVSNGALPRRFRFAGQSVRSVAGVPLVVSGLPNRLRAGRKRALRLVVTDAFGRRVPLATLTVTGAAGSLRSVADGKGRIRTTLPAPRRGVVTFVVSAADLLPVRWQARAAP